MAPITEIFDGIITDILGTSLLIVFLVQRMKMIFHTEIKWKSHLFSFIASTLINLILLSLGLVFGICLFKIFDPTNAYHYWLLLLYIFICTVCANGMYSFSFIKSLLSWLDMKVTKNKHIKL